MDRQRVIIRRQWGVALIILIIINKTIDRHTHNTLTHLVEDKEAGEQHGEREHLHARLRRLVVRVHALGVEQHLESFFYVRLNSKKLVSIGLL